MPENCGKLIFKKRNDCSLIMNGVLEIVLVCATYSEKLANIT